jgi:hypothetical protein
LIAAALLCGCVTTAPLHYYLPQGGGELIEEPCGGGPLHVLRVDLPEGVQLKATVRPADIYPTPYEQIALDLRLLVPEATTLRLAGANIVLRSPSWNGPRTATVNHIVNRDLPGRSPALGVLRGVVLTRKTAGYQLSFVDNGPPQATAIQAVDSFTMQLPTLEINERPVTIPEIGFVRQSHRWMRLVCD